MKMHTTDLFTNSLWNLQWNVEYQRNISLTWKVDGNPVSKSSKFNIWPMYFPINELPHKIRTLKGKCHFRRSLVW